MIFQKKKIAWEEKQNHITFKLSNEINNDFKF